MADIFWHIRKQRALAIQTDLQVGEFFSLFKQIYKTFNFSVSLPAPGRRGCCGGGWPIDARWPRRNEEVQGRIRHTGRQKTRRTPGHHGTTQGEEAMMNNNARRRSNDEKQRCHWIILILLYCIVLLCFLTHLYCNFYIHVLYCNVIYFLVFFVDWIKI